MSSTPAEPGSEQTPEPDPSAVNDAPAANAACGKCGAPMASSQDWCLQCGAGAPGSVSAGPLRGLAGVLALTAVLVLAAAGVGYAALSKKSKTVPVVTKTVAQATPPAATTPLLPTQTTPTTPVSPIAKPPKIPLTASTPNPATTNTTTTPKKTTTTPSTTKTGGSNAGEKEEAKQPEALLLDTDAASTYNPYAYPATWFGDPSLAIDGDTTTAWTAQVNPASAPNLAEGLLIDLKSTHRISAVKLVTSTPGMTVQVYGSAAKTLPASITDPGWVTLSRSIVVKKHRARIGLRKRSTGYRWITLWISRAPASAVGTPEAPGAVSVDELELLPVD